MTDRMSTQIGIDDVRAAVQDALADAAAFQEMDAAEILAHPEAWSIVDGAVISIRNMDDEELRQAVIDDILTAMAWTQDGKPMRLRPDDLTRFVSSDLHGRVESALHDPFVQSLLRLDNEGFIEIPREELATAMSFAGVLLEGHEPLHNEVYLTVAPAYRR